MIRNVPDADEMLQTALWLFFSAWKMVLDVLAPVVGKTFDAMYDPADMPEEHKDESEGYIIDAQPDLRLSYVLLQQSHELGLKARICSVNPYLLFLGADIRSWTKDNADFLEARTLDAVDLVAVVNAVCPDPLSEKFKARYDILRGNRNKIYHLGIYKDKIDPNALLDVLIEQYGELFIGHPYVQNRLENFRKNRLSRFNWKRTNERSLLFDEMAFLYKILNKSQFEALFGFPKSARRYMCHACCQDADIENNGLSPQDIGTATLTKDGGHIVCHVCKEDFEVSRNKCVRPGCKSNVISKEPDYFGLCHICGYDTRFEED